MSWVAAAIGGSALIGGAASWLGAKEQAKGQQQALDFQKQQYYQNQADMAPYKAMGTNATTQIGALYGPNGLKDGWQNFINSPDYQWSLGQGMGALQNSAAAKGGLLSGNFAKGALDYSQGLASTQFGNYYNRLFGQAQLGQTAAAGAGALGQAGANAIGSTYGNLGTATGSGFVGAANAINSGAQNYLFANALNNSSYGKNNSSWWNGLNQNAGQNMYQGTGNIFGAG